MTRIAPKANGGPGIMPCQQHIQCQPYFRLATVIIACTAVLTVIMYVTMTAIITLSVLKTPTVPVITTSLFHTLFHSTLIHYHVNVKSGREDSWFGRQCKIPPVSHTYIWIYTYAQSHTDLQPQELNRNRRIEIYYYCDRVRHSIYNVCTNLCANLHSQLFVTAFVLSFQSWSTMYCQYLYCQLLVA